MEKINYSQIYTKLTKSLSPKVKGIFERRFGVKTGEPETLESIGKSMKITRERVRQIEEVGFNHVRKNHQETLNKVFDERIPSKSFEVVMFLTGDWDDIFLVHPYDLTIWK